MVSFTLDSSTRCTALYDWVMGALHCMTDTHLFNLAPSRVTVSTVGVVPKMHQLIRDAPGRDNVRVK